MYHFMTRVTARATTVSGVSRSSKWIKIKSHLSKRWAKLMAHKRLVAYRHALLSAVPRSLAINDDDS